MANRWMHSKDIYEIAQTDRELFGKAAFDETRLGVLLQTKNVKMIVFQHKDAFAGYGIYLLGKDDQRHTFDIMRCVVVPELRRKRIGSRWLAGIMSKAQYDGSRPVVRCLVSERNLAGQLFAKAMKFQACQVVKEHLDGDDYYCFIWDPKAPSERPVWRPQGTVSEWIVATAV